MSILDERLTGLNGKKNEPIMHKVINDSFLFVPPAEMVIDPSLLIQELYREIFFDEKSEGSAQAADSEAFEKIEEKIALNVGRGRSKQGQGRGEPKDIYAQLYPSLARYSWYRGQHARLVRNFFFRPLAQAIFGNPKDADKKLGELVDLLYTAFRGANSGEECKKRDIFSLGYDTLEGCCDKDTSVTKLMGMLGVSISSQSGDGTLSVFKNSGADDELAQIIYEDTKILCELESEIDRVTWISLAQTFVRIASSCWLLAQMRMSVIVRDAVFSALAEDDAKSNVDWVSVLINDRCLNLLTPGVSPTTQVNEMITQYIKARVELTILVSWIEKYEGLDWSKKSIVLLDDGASSSLSLDSLITHARSARKKIEGVSIRTKLTQRAEEWANWKNPTKNSVGKGIDEYLRVLRKMVVGDESGGHLLEKSGSRGFIIFPGHLSLKLMTFLSSKKKEKFKDEGRLVLADLEKQFLHYGIDFSQDAGVRPKLIKSLSELGLLKGSPDAGDGLALKNPFNWKP